MLIKVKKNLERIFFPVVHCFVCGEKTSLEYRGICNYCLDALLSLDKGYTLCDFCGIFYQHPFSSCPQCFAKKQPRSYKKAVSCYPYENEAKKLVLGLKFQNARYLAEPMAKLMSERIDISEGKKYSCFIPVPLHKKRIKEREYNQAELLAQEMSYLTGIPLKRDILVKVLETKSQSSLDKSQRQNNVIKAFALISGKEILGKSVILVDDVITTGSTVNECAKILKRGGANEVKVLTFCGTNKNQ